MGMAVRTSTCACACAATRMCNLWLLAYIQCAYLLRMLSYCGHAYRDVEVHENVIWGPVEYTQWIRHMHTYIDACYINAHITWNLHIFKHVIRSYMHAYINSRIFCPENSYIHTEIHIHTHIPAYIHTHIHTYTHMCAEAKFRVPDERDWKPESEVSFLLRCMEGWTPISSLSSIPTYHVILSCAKRPTKNVCRSWHETCALPVPKCFPFLARNSFVFLLNIRRICISLWINIVYMYVCCGAGNQCRREERCMHDDKTPGCWFVLAPKEARLQVRIYMRTCTHAHMHTCIYACMHTCTHAYMHACTHACTHAYMHTCIHAHIHTCAHAYIHAHIIHAHMHTCTHAHMHAYTCFFPRSFAFTFCEAHMHA